MLSLFLKFLKKSIKSSSQHKKIVLNPTELPLPREKVDESLKMKIPKNVMPAYIFSPEKEDTKIT